MRLADRLLERALRLEAMEDLKLDLSREAAVVLHEWLARFNETGESAFADQAEQ